MVSELALSAVLSEFARTLITDFPIEGILDHLMGRIVELLPVTSVGVSLMSEWASPRHVAASDAAALRFEQLQSDIGQGPCVHAYTWDEAVAIPDLAVDIRFPDFSPAAVASGLAAVFTFPLRHGGHRIGALDLYRDTTGRLDDADMAIAQTLADVAAAYLLNAQSRAATQVAADRVSHLALHDALTGLPNRRLLQQRITAATTNNARSATAAGSRTFAGSGTGAAAGTVGVAGVVGGAGMVAALFVDLDRFKQVNDTHGHQAGDELLTVVAGRLASVVRAGDTVARVSGDEFVFLCLDVRTVAEVRVLVHRVQEVFEEPFVLPRTGVELVVTASVGAAYAEPSRTHPDTLVAEADLAMYRVKRRGGGNQQILDLRDAAHAFRYPSLEQDLRWALIHGDLDVAYQPIVRCSDGVITSVEALLRWTHPERGVMSPAATIMLSEHTGLIDDIGAWILERSCRDRQQWVGTRAGSHLGLAVNVSARQLATPAFLDIVTDVLAATGTAPQEIILEMTENVLIGDNEHVTALLCALKDLGVRLALDDFGTGYSSLSYLRRLPIDIVKIDRVFTADIDHTPRGNAIVEAVTNLAHVLGFLVTVEGVETRRHHNEIVAMNCDHAQGFFYARPMSAAAINTLLVASETATPSRVPRRL